MADPAVESAQKRLEIEESIARVMAKEGQIMVENEKLRAAQAAGNASEVSRISGGIKDITDSIKELRESTGITTSRTSALNNALSKTSDVSSTTRTSVGGLSDAASGLSSAATFATDKLVEMREELQKISENRYQFVTNIASAIGGSSRLYAATIRDVKSFSEEMGNYNPGEKLLERTADYYKEMGMLSEAVVGVNSDLLAGYEGVNKKQVEFIANIGAGGDAFKKAQYAAREFYGLASGFRKDSENGPIVADDFFRIQGVPIEDVFGSAEEALRPLTTLLSDESLNMSVAKRMHDEASADAMIRDTTRMSIAMKAFGMSTNQTTELVRLNYINTGEAGTDYFNSLTKAAILAEKSYGYSSQLIIEDVTKMSSNFETFGFRTADDFAKISAAAHDAHLTISDLQGVMSKFNTFESAASAVGQLNSALGTNFDALELMTLKFEDPAQFIQRLREGFVSAGKTFEDLPATYRTMITQQLGITMEGLRGVMDGSARTLDDLTSAREKAESDYQASGTSETQRQKAMDEVIKNRVKITGDMIDNAKSFTAQAERAANRFANTSNAYIERTAQIGDIINKSATKFTADMIPNFNKLIETSAENMSAIIIKSINKAVDQYLTQYAAAVKTALQSTAKMVDDFNAQNPNFLDSTIQVPKMFEAAQDVYVSPGGSTVVTANFGDMNQKSYVLDKRDELIAKPPPETTAPTAAPAPAPSVNLPAVTNAIRASLQGAGTSLRIELDVGQLTDLVLRDIMMNKPNVFGGVG